MANTERNTPSTIMPSLRYKDAPAAIDWLCQVFGFARHAVYANPDGTIGHAELTLGGGMIMLGRGKTTNMGAASNRHRNWAAWRPAALTSWCRTPTRSSCKRGRGGNHRRRVPEHGIRQPRVQRERPGRPFVERRDVRSVGGAWVERPPPGTRTQECRLLFAEGWDIVSAWCGGGRRWAFVELCS